MDVNAPEAEVNPPDHDRFLRDGPDWLYLLRELYDLYLRSSAGGSQRIRSHQRVVREQISQNH